jgi:hypothetical protein
MKKTIAIILTAAFLKLTGLSCLAEENNRTLNLSPAVKYSLMNYTMMPSDLKHTKEYYLKKSKNRKTEGWILIAVGGMCLGVYAVNEINHNASDDESAFDFSSTYNDFLGFFGGICILGGTIDFISSSNNARKAASLSLNMEQIRMPQLNSSYLKATPALCLKINF